MDPNIPRTISPAHRGASARSARGDSDADHPSVFQLAAFGRFRLPAPQTRMVLLHLRSGCGRCRATLSPFLLPWIDEATAAEARAADPARCTPEVAAAYLRAAGRAARAAAWSRRPAHEHGAVRQVLAILDAEGLSALGRLPRHLLGWPATVAVLRRIVTLGPADPRLRRRLAEIAFDLAAGTRGGSSPLGARRALRCRAAVELANAHRVLGDHRAAEAQLEVAAADLGGRHDPLARARWLEVGACLRSDRAQLGAARKLMAGSLDIYRQTAHRRHLVHALATEAKILEDAGVCEQALDRRLEALRLLDHDTQPELASCVLTGISYCLLRTGHRRTAVALLREHTPVFHYLRGANAARAAGLEASILDRAGDTAGAERCFALSCRRHQQLDRPYEAGVTMLTWAAAREERGDLEGARALVGEATGIILGVEPDREVYSAMMLLRATCRFTSMRWTLPLDGVVRFLYQAWHNPAIRLQEYLDGAATGRRSTGH
jgi:hypothetical protein